MRRGYHRQARTIPVRANDGASGRATTDQGNYFRCWNCGFICDIRRDELSKDGRHRATHAIYTDTLTPLYAYGDSVKLSTGVGHDIVLVKENTSVYHVYTVSGSGCPLCHSTAWKKL